jgi:hypothetical protein
MTTSYSRHCIKRKKTSSTSELPSASPAMFVKTVARVCRTVVLWPFQISRAAFTHHHLFIMAIAIKESIVIYRLGYQYHRCLLPLLLGSSLMWSLYHVSVWNFIVRPDHMRSTMLSRVGPTQKYSCRFFKHPCATFLR